ncbi:MAG: efflux RND transporter periplasmic adaptor subunit [Gammaproteobacteria bacterium]|nr:efflux RND transporter periplasmic adaptor subunit [Gammaproteobacteria bacterium]
MRVCLVEDSFKVTREISRVLGDIGFSVEHYISPEEAMYFFLTTDFDLLLVGQCETPEGMDCIGLLRTLRIAADPRKRAIPRVVLTSDAQPENLRVLELAGAHRIILRRAGVNFDEALVKTVQAILAAPPPVETGAPPRPNKISAAELSAKSPSNASPSISATSALHETLHGGAAMHAAGAPHATRVKNSPPPPQHTQESIITSASQAAEEYADEEEEEYEEERGSRLPQLVGRMRLDPRWKAWMGAVPWQFVAAFVLLTAGGTGVYLYFADVVPVEVVAVQEDTLSKSVNGAGRVVSNREVELTSPMAGQIVKVGASEGEMVKKGRTLVKLDDREVVMRINRLEAQLTVADQSLEFAQRVLSQLMVGGNSNIVPSESVTNAQQSYNAAKAKQLMVNEELRAAKLERERLKVDAPFDGLIVRSMAVEGLWVQQATPMFALADMNQREVSVVLDVDDARDVAVGQSVKMSSEAFPALEWKEKLIRVLPPPQGKNTVTAFASLGRDAPSGLRYGNLVETQIVTESRPNTLKVPFEVIQTRGGRPMVAVVDENRVHFRPVDVGLKALTDIEVISGVSRGELVVLPRRPIEDNQRVEPTMVAGGPGDVEGFPLRSKFPSVEIFTTDKVRRNFNDIIIVDVRSRFEFDVAHIARAVNVPIGGDKFGEGLLALRPKDSNKPIAFYCNGHSCAKSYEAVQKAQELGFRHTYAYDSGIMDWMRQNRDKTTLLDITPAPVAKMVSEEYFKSRLVDIDTFTRKAKDRGTVVVDIRDAMQRKTAANMTTVQLPLDQFIAELKSDRFRDKQLLIFDAVGKQVRWLQYILEDRGLKDYFFLKHGLEGRSS